MKAPVLVIAAETDAHAIRAALGEELVLTITDDLSRARALASIGGFLAILAAGPLAAELPDAVEIDPTAEPNAIAAAAAQAIATGSTKQRSTARYEQIGAIPYDEYIELAHYAATRRYLIALLNHHRGCVSDAARGANMKRESLYRLMRRHHVIADDLRER